MKNWIFTICLVVSLRGVALAQGFGSSGPVYVRPAPSGGWSVTQPGAWPPEPPAYIKEIPSGNYEVTQPGAYPYEPPITIKPMANGGYAITQPGGGSDDDQ